MSVLFTAEFPEPSLVLGWSRVLGTSPEWQMRWTDTRNLCSLRPLQAHSPTLTLEATRVLWPVGPGTCCICSSPQGPLVLPLPSWSASGFEDLSPGKKRQEPMA